MDYTVSQTKCNDRKRLSDITYYHFSSYPEALEFYNEIKDCEGEYKLQGKEYIVTQMHDSEGKLLELHKHRKYEKWFK
jgi:hypothetical protein